MNIIVLGAGLVGKVMAMDLAKKYSVTSVDINSATLKSLYSVGIKTKEFDLSNTAALKQLLEPFDLVIGAVPGFLGYQTVQAVIESGKNMVDISFFPEDPFPLDQLAKEHGVTVVMDCGVAPGMSNIILGYHNKCMQVDSYECLVGGLPDEREWPYEYAAVFSPIDVIEEYIRPARYVQNGHLVIKEALSDPELININGVGTLESWNSDGLRTLIKTMPHIPNMIEKTLRYPGCIEYLKVLRATGFFDQKPVDIKGTLVRPIDLTAKLLFPKWNLKPGKTEFTAMRIRLTGKSKMGNVEIEYNLLDRTDHDGILSMARTTGYTCTAAAELLINNQFDRKGLCPPEYLGENPEHFQSIIHHLKDRGVTYEMSETLL